jgi:hypothetical protein
VERPSRRRARFFILPGDPSPEELAQAWTLSERDKAEVLRCRGDAERRRFAMQLCGLRVYGRFLPEAAAAPVVITNHLARQLGLPLVLLEEVPGRFATETEHWHRIRAYLGWQSFDETARTRLTYWLTQRATDDLLPSDLVTCAEDMLRVWLILLPVRSTPGRTRCLGHGPCARRRVYPVVTIRPGLLHLKRRDALEVPPRLTHLRRAIDGALPRVPIEDLLRQVDAWCGFTRPFRHPGERGSNIPNFPTTLLATLIAHGTNLGLATMAHSIEGMTADMLQEMSQ